MDIHLRFEHATLRDDTVPEANLEAELWGRQKARRPDADGADQKPDMFTKRKVGGGRRHS